MVMLELEVGGEMQGQPQADAPAENRMQAEATVENMTVEDRPRTPRGAVSENVSSAPVMDDDGDDVAKASGNDHNKIFRKYDGHIDKIPWFRRRPKQFL